MRRLGFTLVEVVVALLVLEAGILGVYGTLVWAARTTRDAERTEGAVGEVEAVLDSLAGVSAPTSGRKSHSRGTIQWDVEEDGSTSVRAVESDSTVVFEVKTWFPG